MAGLDMNALYSLALLGQSYMNKGSDTSKPLDLVSPVTSYAGNINKANMFKHFLDPNNTSALTIDGKGGTMKLDPAVMSSMLQGTQKGGPFEGLAAPLGTPSELVQMGQGNIPQGGTVTTPNPFVSGQSGSSLTPSDMVGLSSQDINAALGAKHNQDQLALQRDQLTNKSAQDLMDMKYKIISLAGDQAYKSKLMENLDSEIAARAKDYPLGDTGVMGSASDYIAYQKLLKENNPNEVKLFEYARDKQGYTGSFMDFKNSDKTGHQKDFDAAVKSGYKGDFNTWMLDMAKAGAINLGGKLEEKKAMSELSGQLYFNDPKWINDLEKTTEKYVSDNLWNVKDPATKTLETAKYKAKQIESQILAGGGTSNAAWAADGKTMVWTVKWPSGDTKEIKVKLR